MESKLMELLKENVTLTSKVDDLENRSRRQNLRIIGLPEGSEGQSPSTFISQLLVEIMGEEIFPQPPELDRAHRALVAKPAQGERPRAVIVRFHRFQEKERALRWAREHPSTMYQGKKILFFPDMSSSLARRRAAFKGIKAKMYKDGVAFALLYPARLRITIGGKHSFFETPAEAEAFYLQHAKQT
ncbi:LINE-1 type transposase domain-containing protein 1 [Astyanax mexicanus]|uniref:LINE-1 type transposase domain-containing protein 1 n=1 Tax=Astyanax mexicanus TaxID=7994 RepID=A0A8T2L8A3_ASTMX|nr:LINE-1 type transposase domain-containing protein 1 [Astyanax mexicanus]